MEGKRVGKTEKELVEELDKLIIFLNKNDVNNVNKEA